MPVIPELINGFTDELSQMRIAFFAPYIGDGGVGTAVTRLADQFSARGHETHLVTFQHDCPFLDRTSIRVFDLHSRRTATSSVGLIRYLRRHQPDAVISTHYFANIVAVLSRSLSLTNPTLILTERLQIGPILTNPDRLKDRLLPTLMRLTYPRADRVVAVSQTAAKDLVDFVGLDREHVVAIYNPTLVDRVFEGAEEPVDHPWFGSEQPPVVLAAGRLAPEKDFQTLIRAFSQLTDRTDARLLILGEGRQRATLERLIHDLGVSDRVELYGFAENPYKFMQAADLFVLSSRHEGMPNVLVEAAALGTPIVATDCPSGPRELLDDGRGGELVPVGDAEALADAICRQLTHPERAQEQIQRIQPKLEAFSPEYAGEQYLKLLDAE